jgi:hypothetical protein
MVYSGQKTVAVAGTRERLASTRTPAAWVILQPLDGNGTDVYVGGANVSATAGNILYSGGGLTFPPVGDIMMYDLYEIWVDVATGGEGVQFNYGVR